MSRSSVRMETPIWSLHATLLGNPKLWTLGLFRTPVNKLPDLWDLIQPELRRLALFPLGAVYNIQADLYWSRGVWLPF